MKKSTPTRLGRVLALGLSAAMMSALALVGAAPAVAAPGDYYVVTGAVSNADSSPLAGVEVSITYTPADSSPVISSDVTAADGSFTLNDIPAGTHTVSFTLEGYGWVGEEVTVLSTDEDLGTVTVLPLTDITDATVQITGVGLVGETVTAETAGWPTGTVFTYQWMAPGPYSQSSEDISGATNATYVVTGNEIGRTLYVVATGAVPGVSAPAYVFSPAGIAVTAPKKAAAPAPTDLTAYLAANDSTPIAQTSTGLPAGALNPGSAQTANLEWFGADSFVDVYVFSTPTFVGTFPVVNGVAQITLSTAVMAQLAAGGHTMVVTGQTSGAVQSVALSIGLPVTGVDVTVPAAVGSLLVLLGAGLMFIRYRFGVRV